VQGGVGVDLGGVEVQLLAPDQPGLAALLDDRLEETAKRGQPVPLPDPGEAGVIGQRLAQVIAELPPDAQPIGCNLDQLPLRVDSLEEHHELKLDLVKRMPSLVGVHLTLVWTK
jgi:hypothetical protein